MRHIFRTLLILISIGWLAASVHGCGVEFPGGESSSNPTPDDIATAALAPKPSTSSEVYGSGVYCPGSFGVFKNRIRKSSKDPGSGYVWHHIVNQNNKNKQAFKNRLHCTDNLIALPKKTHDAITGFYNKKLDWTHGRFVREVIAERSWREQYEYGLQVLRDHGVSP